MESFIWSISLFKSAKFLNFMFFFGSFKSETFEDKSEKLCSKLAYKFETESYLVSISDS